MIKSEIIDVIVKSLDTAQNEDIAEAYNYVVGCPDCPYWHDCRNEHYCCDYICDKLERREEA